MICSTAEVKSVKAKVSESLKISEQFQSNFRR